MSARLAAADAFRWMGLNRREALWQVLALDADETLPKDVQPSLLAGLEDLSASLAKLEVPSRSFH